MWLKTSMTSADTGTAAIAPAGDGHLEVSVQTADTAFAAAGATRCDLFMLDVDGGEFDVLAGAEQFIATTRAAILAELDEYWLSQRGQRRDEIISWAERHSYHAHVIHRDGHATPIVAGAVPDGDLLVLPKEWPPERIHRWTGPARR